MRVVPGHSHDPLRVLAATGRVEEPAAMVLRAVALGQLGELEVARSLAVRAAHGFEAAGKHATALRAALVEAELAVWDLELAYARRALVALAHELDLVGDEVNSVWARLTAARAAELQGDGEGAILLLERAQRLVHSGTPSHVAAVLALAEAEHGLRRFQLEPTRAAIGRARALAPSGSALAREVDRVERELAAPIGTIGGELVDLARLAELLAAPGTVVDSCRARVIRNGRLLCDLASRPALFDLLVAIARAAPQPAPIEAVAREVFGARVVNASHEARLRVELGRLRTALGGLAGELRLERRSLRWESAGDVALVEPLVPRREARIVAVLSDGRAWKVPAIAEVVQQSLRTVQRLLSELERRRLVVALGRARTRRWVVAPAAPRVGSWMISQETT
ncbi:MAG: hypothetical protein U0271_39000 [Polyangiaceae bacterium]